MGINVGKANLDRHAETERELQKGDRSYWSPSEGRNSIRIMPPPAGKEEVYTKVGFHYQIGPDDKTFPCPKIGGHSRTCFLCAQADRLDKSKDEDDQAEAKELRATRRFLVTIVDLDKAKEGFKVWPVGVKLFREILYYFSDPDYGDVSDLEDGYDFTVIRKGSGFNTEYSIRCAKKPTNFFEQNLNEGYPEDKYEELPDLDNFLNYVSDDEMEAAYNGASTGTTSGKRGEREEEPEEAKASSTTRRRGKAEEDPDEDPEEDAKETRSSSRRGKDEPEEDPDGDADPDEEEAPPRSSGRSGGTGSRLRRGLR